MTGMFQIRAFSAEILLSLEIKLSYIGYIKKAVLLLLQIVEI